MYIHIYIYLYRQLENHVARCDRSERAARDESMASSPTPAASLRYSFVKNGDVTTFNPLHFFTFFARLVARRGCFLPQRLFIWLRYRKGSARSPAAWKVTIINCVYLQCRLLVCEHLQKIGKKELWKRGKRYIYKQRSIFYMLSIHKKKAFFIQKWIFICIREKLFNI